MPPPRPTCPFCDADWTDVMLAQLDAVSAPSGCACCAGGEAAALPVPTEDLCCAACGRAIYRMPAHIHR